MTNKDLYRELGNIDPSMVEAAAPAEKVRRMNGWMKWAAIAACLCLVVGVVFRVAIGFAPNQATDVFREGNLIEITNESELPAQYNGNLLAFNLNFENYEFYYENDGVAENTDDWYSLLSSKGSEEGRIVLHCMFGETTIEDWKVSKVFTKKTTETININGIEVLIARHEPSLQYAYWHYAIFEYDNVVYDIRVQSDNADYVFEVLNQLLSGV